MFVESHDHFNLIRLISKYAFLGYGIIEMEERLESDSSDLYEEPLSIRKGMNIQDY